MFFPSFSHLSFQRCFPLPHFIRDSIPHKTPQRLPVQPCLFCIDQRWLVGDRFLHIGSLSWILSWISRVTNLKREGGKNVEEIKWGFFLLRISLHHTTLKMRASVQIQREYLCNHHLLCITVHMENSFTSPKQSNSAHLMINWRKLECNGLCCRGGS